jgi:hypothetical protein
MSRTTLISLSLLGVAMFAVPLTLEAQKPAAWVVERIAPGALAPPLPVPIEIK